MTEKQGNAIITLLFAVLCWSLSIAFAGTWADTVFVVLHLVTPFAVLVYLAWAPVKRRLDRAAMKIGGI